MTARATKLIADAESFGEQGKAYEALKAANQALSIAQKERDPKVEAEAWYAVTAARFERESEDAMEAAKKTLALVKGLGNKAKEAGTLKFMAQGYLSKDDPQEALASAKEAVAIAKEIGDGALAASATEVMVEAHIASNDPVEAMKVAEDELARGDKAGTVPAMSAVVLALTALKGVDDGLSKVKSFVEDLRRAGDLKGEATMLHKLACMSSAPEEAMNSAQVALSLAQKVGDGRLEKAIKSSLTDMYVAKGKVDKAPNRREALAVLGDIASALDGRNSDKFDDAFKRMNGLWNALTQNDFEKKLYPTISKNPPEHLKFLKDHGMDMGGGQEEKKGPEGAVSIRPVPASHLYIGFRIGGLGYGPRYRCCEPAFKSMQDNTAMGCVQLQDCSDDWERELCLSPSMFDCTLQTAAAMGHQV